MKTNKILLGLFFSALIAGSAYAQDVSINISPLNPPFLNKTFLYLEVKICNEGTTPGVSAPANRLYPIISFGDNVNIVDVLNQDDSPLTGYTILGIDNSIGIKTVRLEYNPELQFEECKTVHVKLKAFETGDGEVTASLGFSDEGQTEGNNTANDNASGLMTVETNLPVTLKEFNANAEGEVSQLSWSTTEEINSDRFDVQRSRDGKSWATIETVNAQGDSKEVLTYHAIDKDPFSGENFYRLHMIDKDGTSAYSRIRMVSFKKGSLSVYPNPVTSSLTIDSKDWENVASVQIVNRQGVEVYNSGADVKRTISVKHLPSGTYIVVLKNLNGASNSHKIVVAN